MTVTLETLAAVFRIAKELIIADGKMTDEEAGYLYDFFRIFPELESEGLDLLMTEGDKMSAKKAASLIKEQDEESRQEISNLFANILYADGDPTGEEETEYSWIMDNCGLPEPDRTDEEEIIPAYIVANYHGVATLHQSENEDWSKLGDELAEWIGCDRVEVVRFTPALNALSKVLRLNGRHLVFMVARNGYGDRTVGDNMTATLLYGGGYPIYGNIVFAFETDEGYEIEGFRTRHIINKVFDAVNDAVDGLLRLE